MRTGSGTKGTRHYDWAMLEVTSDDTPDEHGVLLARRHRYTGQLSFYRCWTTGPVPLSKLITIASARWRIEEDHQLSEQVAGLDAGQVICWKSWHRWTVICLLACTYRAVAAASQRQYEAGSGLGAGLIPVTIRGCCGSCVAPSSRRPGGTGHTGCTGRTGDDATSTVPAGITSAGTPTPRQHHDHIELQLPYQWRPRPAASHRVHPACRVGPLQ